MSQNYKKAIGWYQKAAEQGYASAQYNLGVMYNDGKGVPQNYQKAYFWYSIAVTNGNTESVKWHDDIIKKLTPKQITSAQEEV